MLVACGGAFGPSTTTNALIDDAACPELRGGATSAAFAADASANATIRAFVTASGDLAVAAADAEAAVLQACTNIARDLGAGVPANGNVSTVCKVAGARIDSILKQSAHAEVTVHVTPPQCSVRADAEAQCKAQCAGSFDPGYVKAHCQPGHLYGRCSGECTGTCNGTCNGQASGQANGQANGARANGQANGQASGQCRGRCDGECHGGCTADFQEPKCDVAMQAPRADAHCEGSCKAHADLEAQCSPAQVEVRASSGGSGELGHLAATLRANLPALIRVEVAYGSRIAGDVETLVRTGAELPNAVGHVAARGAACMAASANACASAQASLRVSVQASASITARASARAGG